MRVFIENVTKRQIPVTYQAPARAFQILSRVAEAPERLLEEDGEVDRRFIAALTISGLAAPGFSRLRPTCRPVRGRSGRVRTHGRVAAPSRTRSLLAGAVRAITHDEDIMFIETNPTPTRGGAL